MVDYRKDVPTVLVDTFDARVKLYIAIFFFHCYYKGDVIRIYESYFILSQQLLQMC